MTDAQAIFDQLAAPFPTQSISWRVGSTTGDKTKGMALAYIDARDVMDRLDGVVGPANWQSEYTNAGNNATCCRIGIHFEGIGWVWKSDGAGQTDVEGDKGQFSDAFKRAAVHWGIGRYLYELDSPWVAIEPFGKSFRIAKTAFPELADVHDKAVMSFPWGAKQAKFVADSVRIIKATVRHFCTQPSDAVEFRKHNDALLRNLPVAARNNVFEELDRIGGRAEAAE